jgi:hypothetical protein
MEEHAQPQQEELKKHGDPLDTALKGTDTGQVSAETKAAETAAQPEGATSQAAAK